MTSKETIKNCNTVYGFYTKCNQWIELYNQLNKFNKIKLKHKYEQVIKYKQKTHILLNKYLSQLNIKDYVKFGVQKGYLTNKEKKLILG